MLLSWLLKTKEGNMDHVQKKNWHKTDQTASMKWKPPNFKAKFNSRDFLLLHFPPFDFLPNVVLHFTGP